MLTVLRVVIAALLAAGAAGLAVVDQPGTSDAAPPAADGGAAPTTPPPLTPGRARVTGTVTNITATNAGGDAIHTPFTITVADAGAGRLTIPSVLVEGERRTVEWSGGRPLPVTGLGGLEVGGTTINADGNGVSWALDGAPRALLRGRYTLGSTVAVGGGGLSASRDTLTFDAGDDDGLRTEGGVVATASPRVLRIESPNGTLEMTGTLTVETATVTRPLGMLRFGPGVFTVALVPVDGGYTISAALDGAING